MIKLAIETPSEYVEALGGVTDYDFVEASLCCEDQSYFQAYLTLRTNNPTRDVIVDNGAFLIGKSFSPMKVLQVAKNLEATMVILPDSFGNKKETLQYAKRWFDRFKCRGRFKVMGVLQGQSMKDWDQCYASYIRMGVDIIGIPYSTVDRGLWLEQWRNGIGYKELPKGVTFHILGLKNPFDVLWFRKFESVVSLDTSLPVMSSITQCDFSKGQFSSGHFSSHLSLDPIQLQFALKNIQFLRGLLNANEFSFDSKIVRST
jgi:hypothetical protein